MKDLLYGFNTVYEVLKRIKNGKLYIQNNKNKDSISVILKRAKELGLLVKFMDKSFFNSNLNGKNHQGLALETTDNYLSVIDEKLLLDEIKSTTKDNIIVLILDGITDVGNFGAILRNAVLFNVDFVVLPKNNSAPINGVTISHSAGAVFEVEISYINNLVRFIGALQKINFWVYALDKEGKNIGAVDFSGKNAVVFGNEHRGLRPLVKKSCDEVLTIPTSKKIDSLNVSVSVGITLFEINRSVE